MDQLTDPQIAVLLAGSRVSRRTVRELKYSLSDIVDWAERDFLVLYTRAKSAGVLIFNSAAYEFSLEKRKARSGSGRIEPVICDLCKTWRRGSESALITFRASDRSSRTYLCCGDLDCSAHVRLKTKAAVLSKTQLREHITVENRIVRLRERLAEITKDLSV